MKIKKIGIKNFKGFSDETFELNERMTVFIGENAKGKTSILDAIAIAAGSFLRGIDVAKQAARGIYRNEIRMATIEGQPRPQFPVEITAYGIVNNKKMQNGWQRSLEKITPKTTTTFVKAKNIEYEAEKMLKESRENGQVTFPVIAYHGTGRLWAEHEEKKAVYSKQGEGVAAAYINCLSPKSSSKEFLSWYKTFEDEVRKFDEERDKLFLETFNQCILSMIPDMHWQEMAYSFKDDDLIGIFKTSEGNNEKLLFSQLSDGYRNVIGMVADIAYRCIKLNPHLGKDVIKKTPGIVLIDEIDLHLHPNWQRRIVNDLKHAFPAVQFVATTHSPFIVQSLKSDEVWNLDKQMDVAPDQLKIDSVATEIMGVPDPYSQANSELYNQSKQFLTNLEAGKPENELQKQLKEIADPGVRAFMELNKLAK